MTAHLMLQMMMQLQQLVVLVVVAQQEQEEVLQTMDQGAHRGEAGPELGATSAS